MGGELREAQLSMLSVFLRPFVVRTNQVLSGSTVNAFRRLELVADSWIDSKEPPASIEFSPGFYDRTVANAKTANPRIKLSQTTTARTRKFRPVRTEKLS